MIQHKNILIIKILLINKKKINSFIAINKTNILIYKLVIKIHNIMYNFFLLMRHYI